MDGIYIYIDLARLENIKYISYIYTSQIHNVNQPTHKIVWGADLQQATTA
jgi:hypothetical protein